MRFDITEKYYTDKNKTTVCILKIKNDWKADYVTQFFRWYQRELTKEGKKLPHKFIVPSEIKGYARLAEGDTFDLSTGRKIARTKAYEKLDKFVKKFDEFVVQQSKEIIEATEAKYSNK